MLFLRAVLFLLLGCSGTSETGLAPGATVMASEATVLSFATESGKMVTERILTLELQESATVTVMCEADIWLGANPERHQINATVGAERHQLVMRGLLSSTAYACQTIGAKNSVQASFTTGSLPPELIGIYSAPTGDPRDDYLMLNVNIEMIAASGHWILILDYWGNVRWYVQSAYETGLIGIEYTPAFDGFLVGGGGEVGGAEMGLYVSYLPTIYDLSGEVLKTISVDADHDTALADSSFYVPTAGTDPQCIERWSMIFETKEWKWCVPSEYTFFVNSIAVADAGKSLLMTTYLDSIGVVKIDTSSGEVLWVLHPDGSGDFTVDKIVDGVEFQHDVTVVPCEDDQFTLCVLLYDNGTSERNFSRILFYGLDEVAMHATLIRSFERDGWYERNSGGVRQLSNGDWLVTQASTSYKSGYTQYYTVNENDVLTWEMTAKQVDTGGYRAMELSSCEIFGHIGLCPE
jgi:hypothetical protein